jgi:phosphopantothenoylcysteine decarboxylase/phosphopantothenate--cysteine ligase
MTPSLVNKRVLLGVTGSIAAYKSPDLVRRLREAGATVRVAMTENAKRFITPLTLQAVSGYPVHEALFDLQAEAAMGHIELARWADVVVIAPATADLMARLAQGQADDLLTTLCLATRAPIVLAPAMNQAMWKHTLTQANLQSLLQQGMYILGTGEGSQACGDVGPGRMLEPIDVVKEVASIFATGLLANRRVLITAGPTHEPIDPVRYLTNGSSGKMGYALAQAAYEAGAKVTLVSGPVNLACPQGVSRLSVTTAQEMYDLVMRNVAECDIFLAVAAVSDYRPRVKSDQKIHKSDSAMILELERNPDIVAAVGQLSPKPFIVGFAAETQNVLPQASAKRERKKMDMIVANEVALGMGGDENVVTVMTETQTIALAHASKQQLARELVQLIATHFQHT